MRWVRGVLRRREARENELFLGILLLTLAGPSLGRQLHADTVRLGLLALLLLALPFLSEPMSGIH